jgi:hypothetical protein
VLCNGATLAIVAENMIYFRVDERNRSDVQRSRGFSAAQLRQERSDHRSRVLARAGAVVRRTGRTDDVGESRAGGGSPGCGDARAGGANTKITEAKIRNIGRHEG